MAGRQPYPDLEALRKLEARLNSDTRGHDASTPQACASHDWAPEPDTADICTTDEDDPGSSLRRISRTLRFGLGDWCAWLIVSSPRLRKFAFVGGGFGVVVVLAMVALLWRLSSGPIELDMATPWLSKARRNTSPLSRPSAPATS